MPSYLRRFLLFIVALGAAILMGTTAQPSWGQGNLPWPPLTLLQDQRTPSDRSQRNVTANNVAVNYVRLDGRNLFLVSAGTLDREDSWQPQSTPLQERIRTIENTLNDFVRSEFEPDSLTVDYRFLNGLPVLYANDLPLVTVTDQDAAFYGRELEIHAQELVGVLKPALIRAKEERSPQFLQRQALIAGMIVLATLGGSVIIWAWQRRLQRQGDWLAAEEQKLEELSQKWAELTDEEQQQSLDLESVTEAKRTGLGPRDAEGEGTGQGETEAIAPIGPGQTTLLNTAQSRAEKRRLYAWNEVRRRIVQLLQVLLWGTGVYLILGLFPQTRFLQLIFQVGVQVPLQLLLIAIGTYLLIRISAVVISRVLWELEDSRLLSPEASKRLVLRISTFSQVLKRISALLLILAGLLLSLTVIGIPVGPILAGAGIFGLAISFASQSVIKDAINGMLILLEDQYGVGDVIEVGSLAGLVENMDLRITQLRDAEGCLITIPNGEIRAVKNKSKEWSRVDLNIPVPYGENLPQVMRLVESVAVRLSQDFHWQGLILEPPQLMGVDDFSDRGVILKVWIKTQPLKQWDVAREYRRRLKAAFDQKGIQIAIPQRDLWVQSFPVDRSELQ